MKWSANACRVMCSGALLLPFPAAPETQVHIGAQSHAVAATHVDFKIVIPTVLSLEMLAGTRPGNAVQTVAIGSNGRTVALAATLNGAALPRHDLILGAVSGRNIAQETDCAIAVRNIAAKLICTVSMP